MRSRRGGLLVVALAVAAALLILSFYYRIQPDNDAYFLLSKRSGVCAITWSDRWRMCNVGLAEDLWHLGVRGPDPNTFVSYLVDASSGRALPPSECDTQRVVHIGNRGTTVALGNGIIGYFPPPHNDFTLAIGSRGSLDRMLWCRQGTRLEARGSATVVRGVVIGHFPASDRR